jgi:hypothetical protein
VKDDYEGMAGRRILAFMIKRWKDTRPMQVMT